MISTIQSLVKLQPTWKSLSVGLITGCFDIVHLGHISLFEFAKQNTDILIVGIDSDSAIKRNKGNDHPVFRQENRMKFVDSIKFVDYTFLVDYGIDRSDPEIKEFFISLYDQLKVTHLITSRIADQSFANKRYCADRLGIKLLLQEDDRFSSTSKIIDRLGL